MAAHLPIAVGEANACRETAAATFSELGAAYDLARVQAR